MATTLFAAQTAAVLVADQDPITFPNRDGLGKQSIIVGGLVGTDEVELHINTIGSTYEQVIDSSGNAVVLSIATGNILTLDTPGVYKVAKGVTTGTVSAILSTEVKP